MNTVPSVPSFAIPFSVDYRNEVESGEYKVILDCGVEATILLWDAPGEYPIVCIANKENAIPFRTDANGRAYNLPNGSNYSDLLLISAKKSEFEECLVEFFNNRLDMETDKLTHHDIEAHLHAYSERLMAIAEKALVMSGRVISQGHHQNLMEKLSEAYREELKEAHDRLPRWKNAGFGFTCYTDDSISIENTNKDINNPMPALRKGNRYILISDLEKLPKE